MYVCVCVSALFRFIILLKSRSLHQVCGVVRERRGWGRVKEWCDVISMLFDANDRRENDQTFAHIKLDVANITAL